ncbi:excalibur calcium-binding domain-containing protein [Nocardioides eburneiflavus]|uniref:excalibur calcium-binding domain-containing protein n=1 Tax=Nocardioides eburneiflavus TaxID=2518372 RepID=UPI001B2FF7EB
MTTLVRALALAVVSLGLTAGLAIVVQAPASAFSDRDCGDFPSQAAAQNFFLQAGAGDPHRLDDDGDGVACESNPCPCIGRGSTAPQQLANTQTQQTHRETGNVVRVTDGDTLRVRLRSGARVGTHARDRHPGARPLRCPGGDGQPPPAGPGGVDRAPGLRPDPGREGQVRPVAALREA